MKARLRLTALLVLFVSLGWAHADDALLTPLVTIGQPLPHPAGASVLEVGEAFWLEKPQALVFWARHGADVKKAWGLYSLKNGELKTVFLVGDDVIAPHGDPTFKMRTSRDKGSFGSGVYAAKYLYVGRDSATTAPLMLGMTRGSERVMRWDGEKLEKIIGIGDKVTFQDAEYVVSEAYVNSVSSDGDILLELQLREPKARLWAVYDGERLEPLVMTGKAVAGAGVVSGFSDPQFHVRVSALLPGKTVIASICFKGGPYTCGVFRFRPGHAEKIIATGEVIPGLADECGSDVKVNKIKRFESIVASDSEHFILYVRSGSRGLGASGLYYPVVYSNGSMRVLKGRCSESLGWIQNITYLAPGSNRFVFVANPTGSRRELVLSDGTTNTQLTTSLMVVNDCSSTRKPQGDCASAVRSNGGPWPGLIVETVEWPENVPLTDELMKIKEHLIQPLQRFVSADALSFEPPPFLSQTATINLRDVITWTGAGAAVVRTTAGLALLPAGNRAAQPVPARFVWTRSETGLGVRVATEAVSLAAPRAATQASVDTEALERDLLEAMSDTTKVLVVETGAPNISDEDGTMRKVAAMPVSAILRISGRRIEVKAGGVIVMGPVNHTEVLSDAELSELAAGEVGKLGSVHSSKKKGDVTALFIGVGGRAKDKVFVLEDVTRVIGLVAQE